MLYVRSLFYCDVRSNGITQYKTFTGYFIELYTCIYLLFYAEAAKSKTIQTKPTERKYKSCLESDNPIVSAVCSLWCLLRTYELL